MRRFPKLRPLSPLGTGIADERRLLMSTRVAFFGSDIGMREAVLCVLTGVATITVDVGAVDGCETLVGRGREKLAGEGLCGREVKFTSLVKSVKPMTLLPLSGPQSIKLPLLSRSRSEVVRAGYEVGVLSCGLLTCASSCVALSAVTFALLGAASDALV